MIENDQISRIIRVYIYPCFKLVVSLLLYAYTLPCMVKASPSLFEIQNATPRNNTFGWNVKEIEPHICFAWNAQPELLLRVEATRRPSVMGGECTESAPARHALTTGGDTREIERRSFAVRAEDVMGNMRPSVFVQYAKLLRRYCNNFRNKKLSPHSLPFIRDVGEREQSGAWINLRNNVSILALSKKTRRNATTTITRQC